MNFTVDDADSTFGYSNGWAVQSDSDPDRDEFFQSTYHVATADGASMTFQFQGSAFTLYGSKGPGHAKYQVQFDNTVTTLDASGAETVFRTELFSHTFSQDAVHLVKLTAILSGDGVQGKWLDVDYITFTSGNASISTTTTATSLPPWQSETSGSSNPPTTTSLGSLANTDLPPPPSASTARNKVPTILAVLFGILIAVALFVLAVYLVLRRIHDRHRARERAFRYGQSSINPTSTGYYSSSAASAKSGGVGSGGGGGSGIIDIVKGAFSGTRARSPAPAPLRENAASLSYTQVPAPGRDASLSSNAVEMRSISLDTTTHAREREREAAATPTMARPLMSASPIAWTTRQKHKGDADSLRTDFLQV